MNDINLMIEMQHHWNRVMAGDAEIERSRKSISLWEKHLKNDRENYNRKDLELKSLNKKLKENETVLADIEGKLKKADERKDLLTSGRELDAHESEIIRLSNEKDSIEGLVLDLMEKIESSEEELKKLLEDLENREKQTESDISGLNSKIEKLNEEIAVTKDTFNELSSGLSPQVKSRFLKLINSKDGIAIAQINGEICSHCNFQVPSALATAVSKKTSVEICTNCGRFLYF